MFGSIFISNNQATEDIRDWNNLACSEFSPLKSCLRSRREMSVYTKSRVYQVVELSILLYGCETSPVRVTGKGCWLSSTMTASILFYV